MWKKFVAFVKWLIGPGRGALILMLVGLAAGLGVMYIGAGLESTSRWKKVVDGVGTTILSVSLLQLVLRASLWKDAIDSLLTRFQVHASLSRAGLSNFYWYDEPLPWKELFDEAEQVTVLAIAAHTLFASDKVGFVKRFLKRGNTRLTVVLADPDDAELMGMFDRNFEQPAGTRRIKVLESIREILKIADELGARPRVEIRVTSNLPKYSCFRFDKTTLFVPYLTAVGRFPERAPVFLFTDGEVEDKFFSFDLEYVTTKGSKVYAPPEVQTK